MKNYLLLLLTFVTLSLSAQKKGSEDIDHEGKHHDIESHEHWVQVKKADNLLLQHSYYNAIDIYKKVEVELPDNHYLLHQLANSYFIARDYANAEKYYKRAIALDDTDVKYPRDRFNYAETLKMNAKYDEAIIQFTAFNKANRRNKDKDIKYWLKLSSNETRSCNFAKAVVEDDSTFHHVDFINGDVNHAYTDFSPYPQGRDTLYFASLREDSVVAYKKHEKKHYPVRLYSSTKIDTLWSEPVELPFNHKFNHTANGVYSTDKNIFYFTRCYQDRHNKVVCNIFSSVKDTTKNVWKPARKLGGKVNASGYTSTQPTIQHFKKKKRRTYIEYDVLYFMSDRPGGVGGKDIWYTTFNGKKYSSPINCGKRINTIRDEITPRYDTSRSGLFVSSNYHWGLGGFDGFFSKGSQKRFRKPEHLGMPINSSYDDTYVIGTGKEENLEAGYLVTNRPGGIALTSETCCDDIYTFQEYTPEYLELLLFLQEAYIPELVDPVVDIDSLGNKDTSSVVKRNPVSPILEISEEVMVTDSLSGDTIPKVAYRPAKDVKVGYVRRKAVNHLAADGLDVTIDNLTEDIHWVNDSTLNGSEHGIKLLAKKHYSLLLRKEGKKDMIIDLDSSFQLVENGLVKLSVILEDEVIITDTIVKDTVPSLAFEKREALTSETKGEDLKKNEKLLLDDMYFDTNKDKIKSSSKPSLTLLLDFMLKHKGIKIEISGHTDSRGNDAYNMDLSQRRAESVMDYLIENGIDDKYLVAKGYGETEPIAPNENKDGSDNPEGRKLNRRTEIKVLSNKKAKK